MLSPSEFFVGNIGSAEPLCLMLPTSNHDETFLVGQTDGIATAVFLSGRFKSHCFECEGNDRWHGLIIPDVRIEVDETSLIDTDRNDAPSLCVVRTDAKLVIIAHSKNSFRPSTWVLLHDNLPSTGEFRATFSRWQVVISEGQDKRVVWSTTVGNSHQ
ncbi:MAG TPA: hypothetical protein DCX34_19090 [Roseovarius sp.]|nr:hypothetical protein [Roseovarius sp.]